MSGSLQSNLAKKYQDKEWLQNRYINQLDSVDILAKECNCSTSTISFWLHRYGISTRKLGETLKKSGRTDGINNPMYGKKHSKETIEKMRINRGSLKGANNPFYGKHHSEATKTRLSEVRSEYWKQQEYREKRLAWLKTDEAKQISRSNLTHGKGPKNSNWRGGTSNYDYGPDWRTKIRPVVLEKCNYSCQKCGMSNDDHIKKYGEGLQVHHIIRYRISKNHSLQNLTLYCVKHHGGK